jgi:Family of unknown function (DUF6348)
LHPARRRLILVIRLKGIEVAVEDEEITKAILAIFEAHGLTCTIHNEWVLPNGLLPAIRGSWFPDTHNGRLDIHVLIEENVMIEECFAGLGAGKEGFIDALENFSVNSLHVLLAAMWDKNDPDQVTTEKWLVNGKNYSAYVGNFGNRVSPGVKFNVPRELFPAIQTAIKAEPLTDNIHWFRSFFCNVSGDKTHEALLDNGLWQAGYDALVKVPWEHHEGYYGVRNFVVLRVDA